MRRMSADVVTRTTSTSSLVSMATTSDDAAPAGIAGRRSGQSDDARWAVAPPARRRLGFCRWTGVRRERAIVSSEITDEQLEQFHAFAESLDSSVQELVETLAAEGKRSRQARDQVSKVLSAGAGASVVASVKREY